MLNLNFLLFWTSASFIFILGFVHSTSSLLGIHPLDEKYFDSKVIRCKDGSNSFTRDRLNDNYCDCVDGTDEPGTATCPTSKFYCRNIGSAPKFIFSSRVNDRICDCCDGSDEYDGDTHCPNTCIMGGSLRYKFESHHISSASQTGAVGAKETKTKIQSKDLVQKLKGLKLVTFLQAAVVVFFLLFWIFRRRSRSKRRHLR